MELLIAAKADVNQTNNCGMMPLWVAALYGYDAVVELLIEAEEDVNKAENDGDTPLAIALKNGNHAVVELSSSAQRTKNSIRRWQQMREGLIY